MRNAPAIDKLQVRIFNDFTHLYFDGTLTSGCRSAKILLETAVPHLRGISFNARLAAANASGKLDDTMRVLIYGAGVIGSIYAVYLSRSGCEVSAFARGRRLEELRKNGLLYLDGKALERQQLIFWISWDRTTGMTLSF